MRVFERQTLVLELEQTQVGGECVVVVVWGFKQNIVGDAILKKSRHFKALLTANWTQWHPEKKLSNSWTPRKKTGFPAVQEKVKVKVFLKSLKEEKSLMEISEHLMWTLNVGTSHAPACCFQPQVARVNQISTSPQSNRNNFLQMEFLTFFTKFATTCLTFCKFCDIAG